MREPLPPRYWRKVVAATQGIVLTIAAADVLPLALTQAALARRARPARRVVRPRRVVAVAPPARRAAARRRGRGRRRAHADADACERASPRCSRSSPLWSCGSPSSLPNQPSRLTPGAFVRLPLEGLVVVALALVLPATARRLLACVVGPALGLLVIVKILDIGFFATFDRPFDPVADWSYTGIGIETLRDSIGRTGANLAVVGAAVLGVARARPHDPGGAAPDPGRGRPPPAGRSRPSRRSASSGCSAGRSARSSSPARPSPPRAPPAWPSTRYARCRPASRTTRSSPTRSATTASATPPATSC